MPSKKSQRNVQSRDVTNNSSFWRVLDTFEQLKTEINNVVVYKQEVIQIRSIIRNCIEALKSSPLISKKTEITFEISTNLDEISETAGNLISIIRLISEANWAHVAPEVPALQPIQDLQQNMDKIHSLFSELHINVPKYSPKLDDVNTDVLEIYNVFAAAGGANSKIKQRIDSCIKYMKDHDIQIPEGSTYDTDEELKKIFSSIREYIIRREDFVTEKEIGIGASGRVYLGVQKSTNRKVAIKQLQFTDVTDVEVESLGREIAVLSSLHHRYLIEFVGATNDNPYWIITEYMSGGSLYHWLRECKNITGIKLTQIALEVAIGMEYLHSKNIIHRDLKTLNVLLDENCSSRICDFGISRTVESGIMTNAIGTYNYMAPEIINSERYDLKADVFSYGMMLWEMAAKRVPFQGLNQVSIAKKISNFDRPSIPKTVPPPLANLINACWSHDPKSRPTFTQIISRMRCEQICFADSNPDEVRKLYSEKMALMEQDLTLYSTKTTLRTVSSHSQLSPAEQLMRSLSKPTEDVIPLLDLKPEMIEQLPALGFIERATQLLASKSTSAKIIAALTNAVVQTISTPQNLSTFVNSGAVSAIAKMIEREHFDQGCTLLKQIQSALLPADAQLLLPILLSKKCYDSALLVVTKVSDQADLTVLMEPHVRELISQSSAKEDAHSKLLAYYIERHELSEDIKAQLTIPFVLSMKSKAFAEAFVAEHIAPGRTLEVAEDEALAVCRALSDGETTDERLAAAAIACALPKEILCAIGGHAPFIHAVCELPDIVLASKLLYRLSASPACSSLVFAEEDFLKRNVSNPLALSLFIPLAGHFPSSVLALEWFMAELRSNLASRERLEPTIRICGVLSSDDPGLKNDELTVDALLELLKSGECNPVEQKLLMACLYNVAAKVQLKNCVAVLMTAAEANNELSGIAFRTLARSSLAGMTKHTTKRLVGLVDKQVRGKDPYGVLGACEIMKRKDLKELFANEKMQGVLNRALQTTEFPVVFVKLLETIEHLELGFEQESLAAFDSIVLKTGNDRKMRLRIQKLRNEIKLD